MASILASLLLATFIAQASSQSPRLNYTLCSTISSSGSSSVSPVPTFNFGSAVNVVTTSFVHPIETVSEILQTANYTLTNTLYHTVYDTTIHPQTVYEYATHTWTVATLSVTTTTYLTGSPSLYTIFASGLGQELEGVWPASVDCTIVSSAITTAWTTLPTTTITTTITPLNTVSTVVATSNISLATTTGTAVRSAYTFTTTETYYAAATSVTTITENDAPSTVGSIYNAACHPTSLVNAYVTTSGPGIAQTFPLGPPTAVASAARVYMPYPSRDPSACCQLCMQNQGCAGIVDAPVQGQAGLCELFMIYVDSPAMGLDQPDGRCGQILSFGPSPEHYGEEDPYRLVYAAGCAKAREH